MEHDRTTETVRAPIEKPADNRNETTSPSKKTRWIELVGYGYSVSLFLAACALATQFHFSTSDDISSTSRPMASAHEAEAATAEDGPSLSTIDPSTTSGVSAPPMGGRKPAAVTLGGP